MTKLDLKYWNEDTQQWEASLAQGTDLEALAARLTTFETEVDSEIKEVVDYVNAEILTDDKKSITLDNGVHIIDSSVNSPVDVNINGRTLTNTVGSKGYGNDATLFNYSNSTAMAYTLTANDDYTNLTITNVDVSYPLLYLDITDADNADKYYIVLLEMRTKDAAWRLGIGEWTNPNPWETAWANSKAVSNDHAFYSYYSKVTGANMFVGITNHMTVAGTYSIDFRRTRVFEVDKVTYDNIGVNIVGDDIFNMFPYVDNTQHLVQPYIISKSANLLPMDDEDFYNLDIANAGIDYAKNKLADNKLYVYNGSTYSHGRGCILNVEPNKDYTFSCNASNNVGYIVVNEKAFLPGLKGDVSFSITSTNDGTISIRFLIDGDGTALLPCIFSNLTLTPGLNNNKYSEPFSNKLFADVTLCELNNVKDMLYFNNGKWLLNRLVDYSVTPPVVLTFPSLTDVSDKVVGAVTVSGSSSIEIGSGFTIDKTGPVPVYTPIKYSDKHDKTVNATEVDLNYKANLKGAVNNAIINQAHIQQEVDLHTQSIIDLYVKIKGLEG